jgi:multicomponent Na+:H+ antiporter subunit G
VSVDLALLAEAAGGLVALLGAAFMVIGGIGINRMPDVFTRMHAASLSDTAGAGLVLIGLMPIAGFTLVTVKLFFLIVFLALTGPVATHALARAALQAGEKPQLAKPERQPRAKKRGKGGAPSKP